MYSAILLNWLVILLFVLAGNYATIQAFHSVNARKLLRQLLILAIVPIPAVPLAYTISNYLTVGYQLAIFGICSILSFSGAISANLLSKQISKWLAILLFVNIILCSFVAGRSYFIIKFLLE